MKPAGYIGYNLPGETSHLGMATGSSLVGDSLMQPSLFASVLSQSRDKLEPSNKKTNQSLEKSSPLEGGESCFEKEY